MSNKEIIKEKKEVCIQNCYACPYGEQCEESLVALDAILNSLDDLQNIVTGTLASVCDMADKYSIDKDSILKYFADMITTSIQDYKANRTNADRIRNMSDEELAELITNMDFDCADYCDSFVSGCAFNCEWLTEPYKKDKEVALKWLQSEAK